MLKGHMKLSVEPALFEAEKLQLSEPFLIGKLFQTSDHFCSPPLDLLYQVNVFSDSMGVTGVSAGGRGFGVTISSEAREAIFLHKCRACLSL